jgi:ribosomal protein S6--L-glutamate ligase
MKIVVLSRNTNLYSTRRLVEAAEKMGHEVEVIDFLKCCMVIKRGSPEIYHDG